MPLFVVLLFPGMAYLVVDPSGQLRAIVDVGYGDIGDLLPGLVRDPRDKLQHFELGDRPMLTVERVEGHEEDPR